MKMKNFLQFALVLSWSRSWPERLMPNSLRRKTAAFSNPETR